MRRYWPLLAVLALLVLLVLAVQSAGNIAPAPLPTVRSFAPPTLPPTSSLDCPRSCADYASCAQARRCLAAGHTRLDRDHDGVPCEDLCP